MTDTLEIVSDIGNALVEAANIYCKRTLIGTERVPESFYQMYFFNKFMGKYTMSCETTVRELLEWHESDDRDFRAQFRKQLCDLVIYNRNKEDVLAIVEYKNGWLEIGKDIERSIEVLKHLRRPHETVAISCGLLSETWHTKKRAELQCNARSRGCNFDDSGGCHTLHDGKFVPALVYRTIEPTFVA